MNVIVTGASKGIGRGIARVLAREGFTVGALARSEEELENLRNAIVQDGGRCETAVCNLRDASATIVAIDSLTDALGGINGLINNAGLVLRKSALDITMDEWHAMIETNVNGLFYATRAVLPRMKAQGSGTIINVSSISGRVPLPGGSGYAATKFAVTGFSQSLFQEVRDFGIRVTTLYPGSIDTDSHRHDTDAGWKVQPEEVGEACAHVLRAKPGTVISELEIRPRSRPPKP